MSGSSGEIAAVLGALAHPLRVELLDSLGEREASPSQLAQELGQPLGTVSYHVTVLRDAGHIVETRTEPVRGAMQHFYRAAPEIRQWASVLRELPVPRRFR